MEKKDELKYQEKKQHGSRLFPFNIYPCTIPLDFPSVALHWHKDMEIIYIKKGKGIIQLDMRSYEGEEGDIFVVPPGTLHAIRKAKGYSMEYENIIYDMDFLGMGAADVCAGEYLVPLAAGKLLPAVHITEEQKDYREIKDCLHRMEDLCETKEKGYELGVKAAVLQLLFYLIRKYPKIEKNSSPDMEKLKDVLQEIEQKSKESLSVADMAAFCGWSSSHFMRWFKNMTGTSFSAYVIDRHLASAAEMLRQTDKKILAIAEEAGFTNLSNFNRQFKGRYGVTPREYRK